MRQPPLDDGLVRRLYDRAKADRWSLPLGVLAEALRASAAKTFQQGSNQRDLERYFDTLHLEDLAIACACGEGTSEAWDYFVLEYRPALYRAADVLDPSGSARELADSLYAELYGLTDRDGRRQSLFRYFHGRSSLATWLRAVLAQRYVDHLRAHRRLEPLPDEETMVTPAAVPDAPDPNRMHYVTVVERALRRAVSRLESRDRLRLACYYAQELTLAQIGRLLGEHEATASRHLARTRKALRGDIERQLRVDEDLNEAQIEDYLSSVVNDAGSIDLGQVLGNQQPRKGLELDRSTEERGGRRGHEV